MATLQLNAYWRIAADVNQYILQHKTIGKKGESAGVDKWTDYAYCSNLEKVFRAACEHIARDKWPDLQEIIKNINEIRAIVTQFKRL